MALLDIEKLTLRFGGLTAVNQVDLKVEEGKIFSVIGPNGAGKTTVFNAVTAIYDPSEGAIRFRGAEMRRPFTGKVVAACALIGLLTGLAAALISSNIDRLWKVTLKNNYRDASTPFPIGQAWADFRSYLNAELRVEPRGRRWHGVTYDSRRTLGSRPDEAAARQLIEDVRAMIALEGSDRTVQARDGKWAVLSGDGARALGTFDTREDAVDRLKDLAGVGREARVATVTVGIALILGILVGAGGAASVWRQSRRAPHIVAACGVARTFQNIRLFQEMTVLENVLLGMDRHLRPERGRYRKFAAPAALAAWALFLVLGRRFLWFSEGLQTALSALFVIGAGVYVLFVSRRGAFSGPDFEVEERARQAALEILDFIALRPRAATVAKNLPYGDQRRLEIARAMATKPGLLLLDEPAAGMNPAESAELMRLIRRIRDTGVTVLLIEHHMKVVMGISDRIAVLDYGSKIAEGTPGEVRADPKVIEAYLGKEEVS